MRSSNEAALFFSSLENNMDFVCPVLNFGAIRVKELRQCKYTIFVSSYKVHLLCRFLRGNSNSFTKKAFPLFFFF